MRTSRRHSTQGSNAPSTLHFDQPRETQKTKDAHPKRCCSSPSPREQISRPPKLCILLDSFFAGQQNFSYAVSPRPNTQKSMSSNRSSGRSDLSNMFHNEVMALGSAPQPVVETTKMTKCSEINVSYTGFEHHIETIGKPPTGGYASMLCTRQ